jgi:DNA-directed RNA polymerase subunit L
MITHLRPQWSADSLEKIKFTAYPSVSTGEENVRYSPVCQSSYGLTIDPDRGRQEEFFQNWLKESKKINEQSQVNPAVLNNLKREWATLEIQRCYLVDDQNEPYSFDFVIESVGILSPEYIVLRACEIGASLCEKYTSTVFPDNLIVQESDSRFSAFDFFFQKEDHTLGNLIQTWIDAHKIDSGEVTFVAYDIPHPLRDEMVLRLGVADGKEATARSVLSEAMASCQAMFRSWRDHWASLTNPIAPSSQPVASGTTKSTKKKVVRLSSQQTST